MSAIDDHALVALRDLNMPSIRTWLVQHQPSMLEVRRGWYENLVARAIQHVYHGIPDERLQWARLVVAVAEESAVQGVRRPADVAIRITNLAAHLAERGPSFLDPNELVARCMSLINVPFERAAEEVREWRLLTVEEAKRRSIDELSRLRDAKNLLKAAALHADRITDPQLLNDLRRWQSIRDLLP